MSRDYDFSDPYTKRVVEDDYISPPWFSEEQPTSTAAPSSGEINSASGQTGSI